jgi:hypothetical protein
MPQMCKTLSFADGPMDWKNMAQEGWEQVKGKDTEEIKKLAQEKAMADIMKKSGFGFRRLSNMNWDKSGFCTSGCEKMVTGLESLRDTRFLSATTTSETQASNNVIGFLKSIDHKYPVIEWTPRLDTDGNPMEMLVVHN